jgi:hypothetical protein
VSAAPSDTVVTAATVRHHTGITDMAHGRIGIRETHVVQMSSWVTLHFHLLLISVSLRWVPSSLVPLVFVPFLYLARPTPANPWLSQITPVAQPRLTPCAYVA